MRRCIGSPCSTYLVLRSRDVSPAASPAISSWPMPASASCVSVPGTSGRTGSGGKFENLKKVIFFQNDFTYALSGALPTF
ncbi:unnamed protein product [Staurois parvus]|uniref:Uncharacterized protein n=1 Tax=Staurois parvus TaxID=386267 RepID=A0ABN9DGZ5_9NEOB|nr:unnamed protein product [Staurois parvus]